ncbi:MAG: hypothetical protein Q9195_002914 [Heterodermia aff. obscurata]
MSAARSSSPSRDDLDEISQISKQLTQARKDLSKQSRAAKEATEACEQLKTALAGSKRKEERTTDKLIGATEKLIDAEHSISDLKRLVTKLTTQSALVGYLQAELKHSEEECQKFKEQAAHELRKTQEELKKANEKLEAAPTSTAAIESLLPSQMYAVIDGVLQIALKDYVTAIESSLPGAIKGVINDVFSGALSQTLPRQLSQNNQSQPSTDVLVQSNPGDVQLKGDEVASSTLATASSASSLITEPPPDQQNLDTMEEVIGATNSYQDLRGGSQRVKAGDLDFSTGSEIQKPPFGLLFDQLGEKSRSLPGMKEPLEVGQSSATGIRELKSTLLDSPPVSSFPMPITMMTLQIPPKILPTFSATKTQVKAIVSAPQATSDTEKPKASVSAVFKAPVQTQPVSGSIQDDITINPASYFRKDRITREMILAAWEGGPKPWITESNAMYFKDSSQTSAPLIESEWKGNKRLGSPSQSPRKWQKLG